MLFLSGIDSSSADFWNNNLWMNLAVSGRQSSNTVWRGDLNSLLCPGQEQKFAFIPLYQYSKFFWSDLQDLPQIDELLPSLVASCWQSASWCRCQRTIQCVGAVARNSFDGTCCCLASWGWVAEHHGQGLLPALPRLGGELHSTKWSSLNDTEDPHLGAYYSVLIASYTESRQSRLNLV